MFQLKYKEVHEHLKGKGYNFGPKAVPFVNIRKVNKVLNEVMQTGRKWHLLGTELHTARNLDDHTL